MERSRLVAAGVIAASVTLGIATGPLLAAPAVSTDDDRAWGSAGNGPSNDHFSPTERKLSPVTVGRLHELWSFTTSGDVPNIPTVSSYGAYTTDNGGSVWRLDPLDGKPIWRADITQLTGNSMDFARTSPVIGRDVVIVGDQMYGTVFALSKKDGSVVWRTQVSKAQMALITSSPLIIHGRVYLGVSSLQEELAATVKGFKPEFRGSVVALDEADGHVIWQTPTVPEGYTGGAVWGSNLAVDLERRALYATTGDNYSVPPSVAACQLQAQDDPTRASCLADDDHIDSVLSLDLDTGHVNWAHRVMRYDTWTVSCLPSPTPPANPCPRPAGPDYDFGSAANLFSITRPDGTHRDLVGAGQKSGVYWAFDRDTGHTVWARQVNPGGTRGGIQWGSATDGKRIYVAASNAKFRETELQSGKKTDGGWWSALDAATGEILWETLTIGLQPPITTPVRGPAPPPGARARAEGALTTANGVVFGGDTAGYFVALDASDGRVLWKWNSGGSVIGAPAIFDGRLYWGSGYTDVGKSNSKLYSLGID